MQSSFASISPKLAKLLPLLGSDKSGEVAATVAAIDRTLKGAGLDWHDLARRLTIEPSPYPPPREPAPKPWPREPRSEPAPKAAKPKRQPPEWPTFAILKHSERVAWLEEVAKLERGFQKQVGRALRPAPKKDRAIILDHAGNSRRHGHPIDLRDWSLSATKRSGRKGDEPSIRTCPECEAVVPTFATACPICGADLSRPKRELCEIAGELVEIGQTRFVEKVRAMPYSKLLQWTDTEEKARAAAEARGYRRGWIKYALAASVEKSSEAGA